MKTNKYDIRKNNKIVDHNYKFRDKVMLINTAAYKCEIPYNGPFVITQCRTNGTIRLQCGAKKIRFNIRRIKPYKYDKNVENINI